MTVWRKKTWKVLLHMKFPKGAVCGNVCYNLKDGVEDLIICGPLGQFFRGRSRNVVTVLRTCEFDTAFHLNLSQFNRSHPQPINDGGLTQYWYVACICRIQSFVQKQYLFCFTSKGFWWGVGGRGAYFMVPCIPIILAVRFVNSHQSSQYLSWD